MMKSHWRSECRRGQFWIRFRKTRLTHVGHEQVPKQKRRPEGRLFQSRFQLIRLRAQLDLHVHACGEVEFHERIDRLRRWIDNVEHTLMRADFELLARFLIYVG